MSPLFGKKQDDGETVLVVDVESGSVGAALAHFSPGKLPRVFGETRRSLPLKATHEPGMLADLALHGAEEAFTRVAEVAARVRNHPTLSQVGQVSRAVIFLSPPWGALSITNRALDPHPFLTRLRQTLDAFFGQITTTTEPFGLMTAHTTPLIFPSADHYLVSSVSGEVTELVLLENEGENLKIVAHATMPFGHHYPLRTLLSHGNLSHAEARSALRLGSNLASPHTSEALHVAGQELATEFASVAGELLAHTPARSVVIVAREPMGEWFAHTLAESAALAEVFPQAGEVRAMRASNVMPYVAVHAPNPDLALLLESLFIDTRPR